MLTYAVMSNHFHVLVEVPERGEVGEAELLRRMTALYGKAYVAGRVLQWAEWRKNGAAYLADTERDRLLERMGDISAFVKTLKQKLRDWSLERKHVAAEWLRGGKVRGV